MKIAFGSCICTQRFEDQPVWDWIAAQQPDHLVLLGDAIYMDIDLPSTKRVEEMDETAFAELMHRRYTELLGQPRFRALVQALPPGHVHAIWDDHDFLWDDTSGHDALGNPKQKDKVWISTVFLESFRRTLQARLAPGTFPATPGEAIKAAASHPTLSTPTVALAPDLQLYLHLLDARTHRTRRYLFNKTPQTLLGADQRALFGARLAQAPDAVHLVASSTTLSDWPKHFPVDMAWLTELAARHRILVLSGDIHKNQWQSTPCGPWGLHEATSSGLAVRKAVVAGSARRNFGLLTIDTQKVQVQLFDHGQPDGGRTIQRQSWQV